MNAARAFFDRSFSACVSCLSFFCRCAFDYVISCTPLTPICVAFSQRTQANAPRIKTSSDGKGQEKSVRKRERCHALPSQLHYAQRRKHPHSRFMSVFVVHLPSTLPCTYAARSSFFSRCSCIGAGGGSGVVRGRARLPHKVMMTRREEEGETSLHAAVLL